ncbi:heparinase II/III family protein [Flavobacterium seoulense]|uniref:Heparinase II/III-like protein n=1 Tax=Flavobacterium seoulense TaxID=1492738 RepID=A0A066WQW7_9FLAO|nr:heparinase II/III family protein [Flavobacterium seoulense]KDN56221.1 Heparinase II/III-like protein [Flavobacterium seoulense]
MQSKILIFLFLLITTSNVQSQNLPVPQNIGTQHPRVFGKEMSLNKVKELVQKEDWATAIITKTKTNLAPYIAHYKKDKTWLVSRLQMYWKTKADQVYINGGTFAYADGEAAVPTVKYPGTRNHTTDYLTPKIENILPYMDDPRGLYLQHRDRPTQWEWTGISKSGKIVENINRQIISIARDAAFIYWYTGEQVYGDLAYSVLDTYLEGIYYRKEPIDLSHGHHQTLVGYTSFEVIQEHILNEISQGYDFLYHYIEKQHPERMDLYAQTLQKWADLIIKNGVSFNNWNLLEAAHISHIALVLENNSVYKNGKGAQYYLDQIMNQTSTRQWSMNKLMDYGYDKKTGIWNESPGYSLNVLSDFISFAEFYDRNFDIDLLKEMPILKQAVKSTTQYLYPNKYMVSFGDGHYNKLRVEPILYIIENAQKYGKKDDEAYFTKMYKTIYANDANQGKFTGKNIQDLFAEKALVFDKNVTAGKLIDYTNPLFYVEHNSWLVQRQGEGDSALMVSQIGSLGNHMHSNGIAMELFGKGLPLAPEMGHGSSYFSIEYAEYYTQFPAHNTVIVNGKSKYPEMKSNHGFEVNAAYPATGLNTGIVPGITFSDVSFLEPETNSNQRRVMGIVKNGDEEGYYLDIFRSTQNKGNNIKNEYFYHNMGQNLELTVTNGTQLDLKPTSKLAFGDGDLMAYDYMWDKKSVETNQDFKGKFNLALKDKTVNMNLWMQGQADREVFSVLSPKSTALGHGLLLDDISKNPIPTLVVRQNGEAWNRPFVAIYEPALNNETNIQSVDYFGKNEFVGIHVTNKSGQEDFIFSNTNTDAKLTEKQFSVTGSYGIISKKADDFTLFLGNGKNISNGKYSIDLGNEIASAVLKSENGTMYFGAEKESVITLFVEGKINNITLTDVAGIIYKGNYNKKEKTVSFKLPAMSYQTIKISIN